MKILLVLIKNTCMSVTHPILCVSVHTKGYVYKSLVHITYVLFICM